MSPHLSQLVLDEAVAGLPLEAHAQAHLDGCQACQSAVRELQGLGERILRTPKAKAMHAQPWGAPVNRPSTTRWARHLALAASLTLLATAAVLRFGAPSEETRIKGAPTVEVQELGQTITAAKVGATVTLAVGGAGHGYAAVFALDDTGALTQLWPEGLTLAPVTAGAQVTLPPRFEVTAGGLRVVAAFADTPLSTEPLQQAIKRARPGVPPPITGVWWASQTLEVNK